MANFTVTLEFNTGQNEILWIFLLKCSKNVQKSLAKLILINILTTKQYFIINISVPFNLVKFQNLNGDNSSRRNIKQIVVAKLLKNENQ